MSDFDLNKVLRIVDNDKGMARTLLEMTLELGSADFNEMKKLSANAEFEAAGKLAHKLKSSLATLGFTTISDMMKDLEHYSKTAVDPNVYQEKINNLEEKINSLFEFIKAALSNELK